MPPTALSSTDLGLARRRAGKVRDVYDLPEPVSGRPAVLIVATDRISAFDVVLPTPIPGKGRVLTALALAWFGFVAERGHARTHVLAPDASGVGGLTEAERAELRWRTMVGVACEVVPIECVVRGYLDGSGWAEYRETGRVSGVELPAGLERGSRLPEPIFTPATKAERGAHDENITFDEACARVRGDVMERLRATSLAIYTDAHAHAAERGLLLADTKFEFGQPVDERDRADGFDAERLIIVDEALTPDSSRYWDPEKWTPGGAQASFDKQFVRDYLQKLCDGGGWDKSGPGPDLPEDVVRGTFERYLEAARRLFPELRAGALGG